MTAVAWRGVVRLANGDDFHSTQHSVTLNQSRCSEVRCFSHALALTQSTCTPVRHCDYFRLGRVRPASVTVVFISPAYKRFVITRLVLFCGLEMSPCVLI